MKQKLLKSGMLILPFMASIHPAKAAEFTVSTSTEFRTALITAQENGEDDRIILADGTYKTTDDGYSSPFTFNSSQGNSLTIESTTPDQPGSVIIDGDNTTAGLEMKNAEHSGIFTLKGLQIQNSLHGLKVIDTETSIENAIFTKNTNAGSGLANGAAIFFKNDNTSFSAPLSITKTLISSNQSKNIYSPNDIGGAVFFVGKELKIINSKFLSNSSELVGGALATKLFTNGSINISSSTFSNNVGKSGGAIYADYKGFSHGTINIDGSSFLSNNSLLSR